MTSSLNWRELEHWVSAVHPEVVGLFVDKIVIPERPKFPEGYLKGEWAIRMRGRHNEGTFLFSIRPRHPYLAWQPHKGPKASLRGTHSSFDLALSKYLKGSRLLEIAAFRRDRIVALWFAGTQETLGLILTLIPTSPEACLVTIGQSSDGATRGDWKTCPKEGWPILAQSKTKNQNQGRYWIPENGKAPESPSIRNELISDPLKFYKIIDLELYNEAFVLRTQNAERALKAQLKQVQDRLKQSRAEKHAATQEQDWQLYGDRLKATLGQPTEGEAQHLGIPLDPRLSPVQQVEKFYQNARRKQRRIAEAQLRIQRFEERKLQLDREFDRLLQQKSLEQDWGALEKIEAFLGTPIGLDSNTSSGNKKTNQSQSLWAGKTFVSKEGLPIWVGRNKDENLELTFKFARGSDLWMHVRGRPGAHVLILLRNKKSASLDTLLDAATLAVYYSGGAHWGKTEVDYTFKKHVKRIKNSSEASYTHNKTLLIDPDPNRRERLLAQSEA
jgi:predicted ribosome quality control (RQC) complex YloA/Tae2 family protein